MDTKQFVTRNRIRASAEWADSNPDMDSDTPMNHYTVTLRHDRKRMTVRFSMGLALTEEPTAADVLDCLASDATGYVNAGDFADWCAEYGYDSDSRKAERTYKLIGSQARRLQTLLGSALYETLLWDTERL